MEFTIEELKHILIKLMEVPHQSSLTLEQRLNLIKHYSGDCIGLTNQSGDKLNGAEEEFYVK